MALVLLAAGCDWTQWGYNLGGSRNNPTESAGISELNVSTATTVWVGSASSAIGTSSPVTSAGRVFIGSSNGVLSSFDETGSDQCTAGSPTMCNPQWTSAPEGQAIDASPTVGPNGVLLVGGNNDTLYAYDENGINGCAGTPAVCQPLWTAPGTGGGDMSSAVVANGVAYVHDGVNLYAFDAAGQTDCSGSPRVCQPLWTASGVGSGYPLPVAVQSSTVYVVGSSGLAAFDAAGQTNCGGTPTVCHPLWTAASGAGQFGVAAVGNRVYVADTSVHGFDAAGSVGCSGTPKVCSALWTGSTGTPSQVFSPFAIANNVLYVQAAGQLVALDIAGVTNCSGSPAVCHPLWTGAIGAASSSSNLNSAPAVANGVVFVGSEDHNLYAFDALGNLRCSGGACLPLWRGITTGAVRSSPAVANGRVLVGSNDGKLYAYGNEARLVFANQGPLSQLTATPSALSPSFSSGTTDYVVPCHTGTNSVGLALIAGGSSQSATVQLVEGQAAVVVVPTGNPAAPTQYWIRCLPHDFPQLSVSKPGVTTPGYYLYGNVTNVSGTSSLYNMILDGNGTPVWFQKVPTAPLGLQLLPNDTLAYGTNLVGPFDLLQLDSQTNQIINAPVGPTDGHELLQEPNGNRMIIGLPWKSGVDLSSLGKPANSTIVDCVVQEIDPNGNVLWSWKASDHIAMSETRPALLDTNVVLGQTVYGPFHCNSVDVDPTGNLILLSARADSAVYEINKSTGLIVWKLGGIGTNPEAPTLTIQNDPETTIAGQHDARFQPNGDVSLFDDHTTITGAARGVEYSINAGAGTASLVWEYADPDGDSSLATGSLRRASDGSSLIGWGFHPASGFTEVDSSGNVLFQVTFPNNEVGYRSIKVPTSALSISLLHQATGMIGAAPS